MQLAQSSPHQVMRPLFDLIVELLPCSPPFVQSELCGMFGSQVPWEQLEASDEALARGVGQLFSNFKSPLLLSLQYTLILRLPLFSGQVLPESPEAARQVLSSLLVVFLATTEVPASHPLAGIALNGLPGLWRNCPPALLPLLVKHGVDLALDASRRALEDRTDVRAGLAAFLSVLEGLGCQDESQWIGPILMDKLLSCEHLVTLFFFFFLCSKLFSCC